MGGMPTQELGRDANADYAALGKGIRRLKRRTLGLCGQRAVHSQSTLVSRLEKSGVFDNRQDAKEFLEGVTNKHLFFSGKYLRLEKHTDSLGQPHYAVTLRGLEYLSSH